LSLSESDEISSYLLMFTNALHVGNTKQNILTYK